MGAIDDFRQAARTAINADPDSGTEITEHGLRTESLVLGAGNWSLQVWQDELDGTLDSNVAHPRAAFEVWHGRVLARAAAESTVLVGIDDFLEFLLDASWLRSGSVGALVVNVDEPPRVSEPLAVVGRVYRVEVQGSVLLA